MALITVLSSQNDAKLENGELATDLMSALKEFEETTAKITSAHSQTNDQEYHMTNKITDSMFEHHPVEPEAEKGPIEYFNRTKETLRHVEQISHHNDRSSRMHQSVTEPASDHPQYDNDGNELEDDYVKIPVQQLINTFEKQMRSIIKQKINENIQLKLDAGSPSPANSNKIPATNAPTMSTTVMSATAPPPPPSMMNTIRDNYHCDIAENGKGNGHAYESEMDQFTEYDAVYASRQKAVDFNSMVCQQQQTMTKQMECHEMAQSTIVESTTKRFSNSNETKVENFDGGKAQAISTKSYPFLHHSYLFVGVTLTTYVYIHSYIITFHVFGTQIIKTKTSWSTSEQQEISVKPMRNCPFVCNLNTMPSISFLSLYLFELHS